MQLGLGTAALGRPQYINLRQEEASKFDLESFKQNGINVLEDAYHMGIRYFDTAPGYGIAEKIVMDWLQTKNDKTIKIATKWGYTYVANFNAKAKVHELKEHSLSKLNEQWEVSKDLVPHLQVYQIHSATLETKVLENEAVLDRLAFLKNENQLQMGITTTGTNQVEVIQRALDVSIDGNQLFDAFQVTYNILDQSVMYISDELTRQNKKIIIKEALANGRLFRNKKFIHYRKLFDYLEALAQKYQVGVDAIALNYCGNTIPNSMVLSGASNHMHLEGNIKAKSFTLSQDELQQLQVFRISEAMYWDERKLLAWN
ncbi:MAG: aldo/keto reductase [Maribacter sp.]